MKNIRNLAVAFGVAYYLLLPGFSGIFAPRNRFFDPWHIGYAGALLCAIASWGLIFWVSWIVFRWIANRFPEKLKFLLSVVLSFALGYVLLRSTVKLFYGQFPPFLQGFVDSRYFRCFYYLLPPVLALRHPTSVMNFFRRVYLALFGLFLLNILIATTWPRFPYPTTPTVPESWRSEVPRENRHLFIVIMDEWSFHRTFCRDDLPEQFPHLKEWLDTSTFYTNAYSPGSSTRFSLPRILFGKDSYEPYMNSGKMESSLIRALTPNVPSIFSFPKYEQALRIAIGGHLFYPILLANDKMDVCVRMDTELSRRTFKEEFVRRLLEPGISVFTKIDVPISPHDIDDTPQLEVCSFSKQIRDSLPVGVNSMLWLHYMIPHWPFLDENKQRLVPHSISPDMFFDSHAQALADYVSSLRCMDAILGELKEDWQKRNEWNDSCIVLMSDHEWRKDPDHCLYHRFGYNFGDHMRADCALDNVAESISWQHIPLIIKYPGQTDSIVVSNRVCAQDLYRLVSAYWNTTDLSMDALRAWPFPNGL